jgi:hypothetical protein
MTVVYFTDGALIDDVTVRRSLLRIPDVIRALRRAEKEFVDTDVFLAMSEITTFSSLNYHQRLHLKTLIQNALFNRWMKLDIEPDLIVRRSEYSKFKDLTDLFKKLATIESLHVVTVGPGFDELEVFLRVQMRLLSNPISDVINQDPRLNWFWKDVRSQLQLHS